VRRHRRNSHRHGGDARHQHDRVVDSRHGWVVDRSSDRDRSDQPAARCDGRLPPLRTERRHVRGYASLRVAGSRLSASRRGCVVERVHTDHDGHLPLDRHLQRGRQQRRSGRCLQQHCGERRRVADTDDACRTGHPCCTRRSARGRRAVHSALHRVTERTAARIRRDIDGRWCSTGCFDSASKGTGITSRTPTRAADCRQ
jgi:hypothetical protein